MRRSGLGRGLGSLIPTEGTVEGLVGELIELPIDAVASNPYQPRQHFDEEQLASLTESIRAVGLLQPVLVRPGDEGRYELIAGERRWRAARRAGLDRIPAIVRAVDDASSMTQALIENLHRADLNPLEEGAAYQQLIEDFGLTHEELARRVGKSRAAISNTLRLFQLPPSIQRFLSQGRLSAGHARALLGTPDRALQERLAQQVMDEGWSVRQIEDAVRRAVADLAGPPPDVESPPRATRPDPRPVPLRPAGLLELEELLSEYLSTRVAVTMTAKHGKVTIDFASLEDLERIYRVIVGSALGGD